MELLGKDLEQLMPLQKNKKFSLKTVLMVGLQAIDRIQAFHKIGYVHRDIKPDNLAIGLEEKNKIIYLIDFGLAKKASQQRPEQKGKMLGSLAYMSCRSHLGKQVGYSDDIESLMYTLLFMLTGSLPWMNLKIEKIADAHKILVMKDKLGQKSFKGQVPSQFFDILKKLRSTRQSEVPDYLKIKYKFLQILKRIRAQNDFNFDWLANVKSNKSQQKRQSQKVISPEKAKQQKMKQENQQIVQNQIYEVYKFLGDDGQQKHNETHQNHRKHYQSATKIAKKENNQNQNPLLNKQMVNKRPVSANKGHPQQYVKKENNFIDKIALMSQMQYVGPNITINKTAKHKI